MRIKNYTPVFDRITKELDPLASLIFGRIWRYAQMENGQCEASLQTLATDTGVSVDTVRRRIETLMEADYLSEKEYVFGETRKLTPNYDVMIVGELIRIAESNDPPSTQPPSPLAESDTKIVIKETKEDTMDGIIKFAGAKDKLEGVPPIHAELMLPFCEFYRYPFPDEVKAWVAQVDVWLSRGYKPQNVVSACKYVEERKDWEYFQPASILKAFGKLGAEAKKEQPVKRY